MGWQGWFTLCVILVMVAGLVRYAHVSDVIFLGGLTLLTLAGVISPDEALAGFKNEGMLTVAALFVVAAGLVETGFLGGVARRLLGRATNGNSALRRMLPPAIGASAFLNNTTVVAMAMPALLDWSRKRRVAPSRLLLPLSFASIIGGVCTLIGTSTNLVVHGMMKQSDDPRLSHGFGMWELAWVGVPIAVVGGLYLAFVVPRLLPERKEFFEQLGDTRREYLVEVLVQPICPLIGQSVQDAGLRGLPGLFLIEIDRGGALISPVAPDERLMAGDRLIFTGVVSTIVDLQKTPGLVPAEDTTYQLTPDQRRLRQLCEAVISYSSPLVGLGVREANFRTRYDAAVVAVHRNGRRLRQKIGDIRLESGDTLLLQAGPGFARVHRNNPDFFLVSEVGDADPVRHDKALLAAGITGLMVLLLTLPEVMASLSIAPHLADWFDERRALIAILAAGLMVLTRCLPASAARRSLELNVLLTIAASFGVGKALARSGAADAVARVTMTAVDQLGLGTLGLIAAVYVITWVLTELMSNNAAAALMFPIATAAAASAGVDPRGLAVTVTIAASGGFLLPIGYQTHLMVFGPGGYRAGDFVRAGLPMVIIWLGLALLVIPAVWFGRG